jgi:hypothetical protein
MPIITTELVVYCNKKFTLIFVVIGKGLPLTKNVINIRRLVALCCAEHLIGDGTGT